MPTAFQKNYENYAIEILSTGSINIHKTDTKESYNLSLPLLHSIIKEKINNLPKGDALCYDLKNNAKQDQP